MKTFVTGIALATTAAIGLIGSAANAATYISYLEYWNHSGVTLEGNNTVSGDEFGYVTLVDGADGKSVTATVTLYNGGWLQQSGTNKIFAWNFNDDGATTVSETYAHLTHTSTPETKAPWGTFTDSFDSTKPNGKALNGQPSKVVGLTFTAYNANGLSFAGVGAGFGSDGKLTDLGEGNQFASNSAGWWFLGHYQTDTGPFAPRQSINIAARDAFCVEGCPTIITPVPEPATWAMMLIGFGGIGMSIRARRRRRSTPVVAA